MGTIREPRHELAELLAKREVSDEVSAILDSLLADARAGLGPLRFRTMRAYCSICEQRFAINEADRARLAMDLAIFRLPIVFSRCGREIAEVVAVAKPWPRGVQKNPH